MIPITVGATLTLTIPGAADALGCAEDPTICVQRDIEDDQRRRRNGPRINLDTSAIIAATSLRNPFISFGLRAYLADVNMVATQTAINEYFAGPFRYAGPGEMALAAEFLTHVQVIPDNPSARVMNLPAGTLTDKRIFGTGDNEGIRTMTSDLKFARYANSQSVFVYIIPIPTNRYARK